jgi:hypothetical protein
MKQFTVEESAAANRLTHYLRIHLQDNLVGVGLKKHSWFKDLTQLVVFIRSKQGMRMPDMLKNNQWENMNVWFEETGTFFPA